MTSSLPDRCARILVRFRKPVTIALLISTVVAGLIARDIRFDFSPQSVFDSDDGALQRAEEFRETFRYEDAVLFVLLEASGDDDTLTRTALSWQYRMAEQFARLSAVQRIESIPTLKVARAEFGFPPQIELVPLVASPDVDPATADDIRDEIARSPIVEQNLISEDRRLAAILVVCEPAVRQIDRTKELVASVRRLIETDPPPPGFRVRLGGLPALRVDIVSNLLADQTLLVPLAIALYLSILGLAFRRLSGTLVPLLAVGTGLVWSLAALVLMGHSLTILSNVLPLLLLVIGVSNSVHIISGLAEESRKIPDDRREAVIRTIRHMSVACLLTILTTAVGFASLLLARSEPLRAFAWEASLGLGMLYVSIVATLGAMLTFFRAPRSGRHPGRHHSLMNRTLRFMSRTTALHPARVLIAGALLVAAAFWCGRSVTINSSMIETYDDDHPTIRNIRLIDEQLSGVLPLEIDLQSGEPGTFLTPSAYRQIADFLEDVRQRPAVRSAQSYVGLLDSIDERFRRPGESDIPPDNKAGRERIARSDRLLRRFVDPRHYEAFLTADASRARILLRVRDVGTRKMLRLIGELETDLHHRFPPGCGIRFELTGDATLGARATNSLIRDLLGSLMSASVVIFLMITVLFRSLRIGLISIVPNLTPLALTWGYLGLRGYDMNAGNVIVFAVALGIAVDDTIHFLYRYREETQHGSAGIIALHRTFQRTGRAILLTSVLVIAGMSLLLVSDFVPTRRFAELLSVTMAGALIGDLFLLPALLTCLAPPRRVGG